MNKKSKKEKQKEIPNEIIIIIILFMIAIASNISGEALMIFISFYTGVYSGILLKKLKMIKEGD